MKKIVHLCSLCVVFSCFAAQMPSLSPVVALDVGRLIAKLQSASTYTRELGEKVIAARIQLLEHKDTARAAEQLNNAVKSLKEREEKQKQETAAELMSFSQVQPSLNAAELVQRGKSCLSASVPNYTQAGFYFEQASRMNDPEQSAYAQLRMGDIYFAAQNYEKAFKYYKKAAEQHTHQEPIENIRVYLGDIYHRGKFVPKDYAQAHTYYAQAAHATNPTIRAYVQKKLKELAVKERKQTFSSQSNNNQIMPSANNETFMTDEQTDALVLELLKEQTGKKHGMAGQEPGAKRPKSN